MALSDDQNLEVNQLKDCSLFAEFISNECPLCMEPFEMDDFTFFPCTCGYQICRFCWHRIRTDENDLCPACRKQYPEDPADFKPVSVEELQKIKSAKRQKVQLRKQKMSDCRKHLTNVRVVQKNLVFVVGLPARLADAEVLKKHDYFGKFGKLHKVVVNQSTSYAGSQGPSASAYVTYCRPEDALRAIKCVNNIHVDGRTLKASLGTTKYCSHFLKSQQCPKTDCMYLHELGNGAASFTKEDMQQGKHQEYERKLQDQIFGINRKQSFSPITQQNSNSSKDTWSCTGQKEQRLNKSRDSTQGQKTSRSKGKHNGDENQRSKKNKIRTADFSHNSANMNKSSVKDDRPVTKRNQKHSRHNKSQSSTNVLPLQRVEEFSNKIDLLEEKDKNSHAYVEIAEKMPPSHSSANIKITRSASPSLPPSPVSSSSPSLFTPFGSLSSNFLSSSPSPPPSNVSQPFQIRSNTAEIQEVPTTNTYAMPSSMEHNKRVSPCNLFGNTETDLFYSPSSALPIANDLIFYNHHLPSEDENVINEESDWNSKYTADFSPRPSEDDLDFDPWDESSKGLADLMAKEASMNPTDNSTSMPPGFSDIKTSVPNSQRITIPPPGFEIRQMPISDTVNHPHSNYLANQAFNNKSFILDKRQNLMDSATHLFHQTSTDVHSTNQSNLFHQISPDVHSTNQSNLFHQTSPDVHSTNQSNLFQQTSPDVHSTNQSNLFQQTSPDVHSTNQSNLFHQTSPDVHSTIQSNQFINHSMCDMNSQMLKEYIKLKRQARIQENFRAMFPAINANITYPTAPKVHNQNSPSWNSQVRDLSWLYGSENLLNSGSISDSQRAAPCFMKALQQLNIEDTVNPYNGHASFQAPFVLRGQWPPSSLCPPPGFVAPSSSSASNPFQHVQFNQKI